MPMVANNSASEFYPENSSFTGALWNKEYLALHLDLFYEQLRS